MKINLKLFSLFIAVALAVDAKAQNATSADNGGAANETVTATLDINKSPAVFTAGDPIAFDVILKYTGAKPAVGFVECNRFWTFLFTPVDGGVPRKAVLRVSTKPTAPLPPGGGPNPPLAPKSLENGKEAKQSFVLGEHEFGVGGKYLYEFADAREIPEDQKEKPLAELPPGKYNFTASHIMPEWKGNQMPDGWYDSVTTGAIQIEIVAQP